MTNPKYDITRIPDEIQTFLKYTRCGYKPEDGILLAIVKLNADTIGWYDILLSQEDIDKYFTKYEASNGQQHPILPGQLLTFSLAVLYAKFCFSLPNARKLSQWKIDKFEEWKKYIKVQDDQIAAAQELIPTLTPSQLLSQFVKAKHSAGSNLPLLKQNKEWISW